MKIRFTHRFDVDVETFEEITSDPKFEEEIKKLPNVAERETIKLKEDKRYVHRKVRYFARGLIPPPVRPYLKPKMLCWIEKSTYDKKKHSFKWEILPFYFKKIFECKGTYSYIDVAEKRMRREVEGYLKIKVPFFGPLAEKVIIEHLKKNLDKECKMTRNIIKKGLRRPRKNQK